MYPRDRQDFYQDASPADGIYERREIIFLKSKRGEQIRIALLPSNSIEQFWLK